jgi:hypothetical protein
VAIATCGADKSVSDWIRRSRSLLASPNIGRRLGHHTLLVSVSAANVRRETLVSAPTSKRCRYRESCVGTTWPPVKTTRHPLPSVSADRSTGRRTTTFDPS